MDANIFYAGGNAVKMFTSQSLTAQEVKHLFEKFGEVKQIVSQDEFQIVYFSSEKDAQKCVQEFQCEASTSSSEADPASTGDRVADAHIQKPDKTKNKSMKTFFKKMSPGSAHFRDGNDATPSPTQGQCKKDSGTFFDQLTELTDEELKERVYRYVPNCSSPVLLNTMDPGFRLAYCHDAQDLKPVKLKTGQLNQFSKSIKKYMDGTPRLGTQELVLTNLPPNFKENDVYELCGNIRPEAIELKKTSNINVLYANIRTKTDDDFDNLMKTLGNCQINGVKITSIPITKVENSSFGPAS